MLELHLAAVDAEVARLADRIYPVPAFGDDEKKKQQAALTATEDGRDRIVVEGLLLDLAKRTVELDGRRVDLKYVEFELLRTLAAKSGRVYTRQALLQSLWGGSAYREPRTIDVHVRHLREKLEQDPSEPELILTVRGAGYRLREP